MRCRWSALQDAVFKSEYTSPGLQCRNPRLSIHLIFVLKVGHWGTFFYSNSNRTATNKCICSFVNYIYLKNCSNTNSQLYAFLIASFVYIIHPFLALQLFIMLRFYVPLANILHLLESCRFSKRTVSVFPGNLNSAVQYVINSLLCELNTYCTGSCELRGFFILARAV